MQNYISISRLSKLFLMELRLHRKNYLTISAIFFALSLLRIANLYFFKDIEVMHVFYINNNLLRIVIALAPFILYGFVYHPTKGLTYAMLPASSFEKVLSAWIQCVIVVPILMYATWLLCALLTNLTGIAVDWQMHPRGIPVFEEQLLNNIMIQSFVFWGVFWFKHRKVAKTILTLCAIGLGITLLGSLYAYLFYNASFTCAFDKELGIIHYVLAPDTGSAVIQGRGLNFSFPNSRLIDTEIIVSRATLDALLYLKYLFLPTLPWALAFFKFRRTQI